MVDALGRNRAVLLLCAAAVTLAVALTVPASKPAGAATDRLPDLAMDKLTSIQIETTNEGQRLLRFDTGIVNIGAGAFEVNGSRPDTSTPTLSVTQRIFDDAGAYRERPTTAEMYYAGDGHTHWHLRDLESYKLIRLDNGVKVGTGAKEGFCFADGYRFGSTADSYYLDCSSNQPDALAVQMGLSRGWGDLYGWQAVGQYIDVTKLPPGRYRLQAKADAANWFVESNDTNNFTWANVQLKHGQVSVLRYGPSAQPISG
jgi:hypothetical protein